MRCEVWSTADLWAVGWGVGWGGKLLSAETDSNRCNGLLMLHQGFTATAKTETVLLGVLENT